MRANNTLVDQTKQRNTIFKKGNETKILQKNDRRNLTKHIESYCLKISTRVQISKQKPIEMRKLLRNKELLRCTV